MLFGDTTRVRFELDESKQRCLVWFDGKIATYILDADGSRQRVGVLKAQNNEVSVVGYASFN